MSFHNVVSTKTNAWKKVETVTREGKTFDVYARVDASGIVEYSATVREGGVLGSYPSRKAVGHRNHIRAIRAAN